MLKHLHKSVAKHQDYICPVCKQPLFHNDEELHLHHIKPKHLGGENTLNNLVLLHLFCHQQTHKYKSAWLELYRKTTTAQ